MDGLRMGRKWIYCILIGITSVLLLGLNKLSDYQEADNETGTEKIYIQAAGHEIALWKKDEQYYAFLPSACKNTDIEPEVPSEIDPSSIIWMYSKNIPAVFIDTESGTAEQINSDKNIKEPGHVSVLEADGRISFELPLTYIKGRGNTSYTEFEKKPYQIKLADAAPFLGMDSAKKWVFISNSARPHAAAQCIVQKSCEPS